MNIFVLDLDPKLAAQYHNDKHVVKMITETAQIISTTLRATGRYKDSFLYKPTHQHHPCVKFIMADYKNLAWLNRLLSALIDEYDYRFEKPENFVTARNINILTATHLSLYCLETVACPIMPKWDEWPRCMPDEYISDKGLVESYRAYYIFGKSHLNRYTKRPIPDWLQ
jgi:hypothetical protein